MKDILVIEQKVGKYKRKNKKEKKKSQIWREGTVRRIRERTKDKRRKRELEKISLKCKIYVFEVYNCWY
jgi:hypothetical protein